MKRTIRLDIVKPISCSWDEAGSTLRNASATSVAIANFVQSRLIAADEALFSSVNVENGRVTVPRKPDSKKIALPLLEDKIDKRLYDDARAKFPNLSARAVNYIVRQVLKAYKQKRFKIVIGQESSRSYRKYPFINDQVSFSANEDGDTIVSIGFYSQAAETESPSRVKFMLATSRLRGQYKDAVESLTGKVTKPPAIRVMYDNRKKKWYINVPISLPERNLGLNPNKTMYVLPPGKYKILACVYYARIPVQSKTDRWVEYLEFEHAIPLLNRYHRLSKGISTQYRQSSSGGSLGHGRKRAIAAKEQKYNKYRRACRTCNQQRAAHIVKIAHRWNCGKIVYFSPVDVDIEGFNLLSSWPWYELEECIKNKCEEFDIEFEKGSFSPESFSEIIESIRIEDQGVVVAS